MLREYNYQDIVNQTNQKEKVVKQLLFSVLLRETSKRDNYKENSIPVLP